jgi:hypothetical protein
MAALALMILVTAILATGKAKTTFDIVFFQLSSNVSNAGATRQEVYRSSMGRVGGRIASAAFILIT